MRCKMLVFFLLFTFISLTLYFKFKKYVPILMYHRIANIPNDRNALSPEKFKEQLDYLKQNNFTTITMKMLYDYYHKNISLPNKPVLITFDDGYTDNFTKALPLLLERNMTAVVFPIANWIGQKNLWEDFHKEITTTMNIPQLRDWSRFGMEIGSHTLTHPFLSKCKSNILFDEIHESKKFLENQFSIPIKFFCYPYGDFNQNVLSTISSSGYLAAFAIFENVPLWNINLYALPRIPIPATQKMWEFKLKVSSIHIIFIALRKWERIFKKLIKKHSFPFFYI